MNGGDGVPRKVKIVIEDDGKDHFKMYLEGDIERLSMPQIPAELYSAAEFWGPKMLEVCQNVLQQTSAVKALNRKERRKG